MATPLDRSTIDRLSAWRNAEAAFEIIPGHGSVALLVRDDAGHPIKPERAAVVVSGLYNSPVHMDSVAQHFFSRGMNVLSVRLRGHYDIDRTLLGHSVRWSEWLDQTLEVVQLASELGDRLVLAGHSTGALLLTWAAINNSAPVAGLALFAPAFGVHHVSRSSVRLLGKLGLNLPLGRDRILTSHAARQVEMMADAFCKSCWDKAPRALEGVPVWIGNTEIDVVIRRDFAEQFLRDLQPSPCARVLLQVPRREMILHDRIVSSRSSAWPRLIQSMEQTLR